MLVYGKIYMFNVFMLKCHSFSLVLNRKLSLIERKRIKKDLGNKDRVSLI